MTGAIAPCHAAGVKKKDHTVPNRSPFSSLVRSASSLASRLRCAIALVNASCRRLPLRTKSVVS
jgi:hypothetical protein